MRSISFSSKTSKAGAYHVMRHYLKKAAAAAAALVLCVAVAGTMMAPATQAGTAYAKSKKVKLSAKSITLNVCGKKTLKIKGTKKKAKWSVAGDKLISIKTKGKKRHKAVIKAGSKTGTCRIVVRAGKKKLKCKVRVRTFSGKFISAFNDSSVKLLKETTKNSASGSNILISPDSILTAMAMAENGAAGKTLSEMKNAFGGMTLSAYNRDLSQLNDRLASSKFVKYHIANSAWYKNDFEIKKNYISKLKTLYGAEVKRSGFDAGTVGEINSRVKKNTKNMIDKIIDQIMPDMKLILINAIAFDGKWADQYNDTVKGKFKSASGIEQSADYLEGKETVYVEVKGAAGFIKNYEGGKFAFLALLPPEGMSVEKYIASLSGKDLMNGYKNRKQTGIDVYTKTPEFKYDYDCSLKGPLRAMGIRTAFTDSADFSGISKDRIMISDVIHKTHIELDKNGTKAAAVTAILMKDSAFIPQKRTVKKVYLTRPFVYAIIDTDTGLPLFIGTLQNI